MGSNSRLDIDIADSTKTAFKKSAHLRRWIAAVLLLVLIAAGIILWTKLKTSDAVQYKTQNAARSGITVLVTATGTLKPTKTVDVGSEISGTIKSIEVDYNSEVTVGQVLAKLDTTKLNAEVTQSKAALDSAKAKVLQTKATVSEARLKLEKYEHVRRLSNNKVPSQSEFDAAQAAYDRAVADEASAEAAEAQAQATLEAYQTDLSKAVIYSPINGIVLTRSVEPGQTVAASFTTPVLFTLAEDLTKMELHVDVDEADIGQVKEGQNATFTVDAYPNQTFNAQITQVRYGSTTTSGVVTYETVLEVANDDLSLRPGMTATADIIVIRAEDILTIPNSALRFKMAEAAEAQNTNGSIVDSLLPHPPKHESKQQETAIVSGSTQQIYVLKEGKPAAVSITTGVTDGINTQVLDGEIKEGMPVIIGTIAQEKKI